MDTSNVVAGNLAFKQSTLNGTDQAVEAAYRYLATNLSGVSLQNDNAASGYYSSRPAQEPNWTDGAVWAGAVCMNSCNPDANGNIPRMRSRQRRKRLTLGIDGSFIAFHSSQNRTAVIQRTVERITERTHLQL